MGMGDTAAFFSTFFSTFFSSLLLFFTFLSSFWSISTCISRNKIFSSFNFDSYISSATCALSNEKCYYPIIWSNSLTASVYSFDEDCF